MEPKKFTVIDSETQRTKVIESNATTVAELKADLRANGFNLQNKTIQEGLTRIEFKSDDALLPHDVPRNGTTTNDLVFRLTKSEKHIESGAMSRGEAYAKVKELGLGDVIKAKYGKNFTQCSTSDLIKAIEIAEKNKSTSSKPKNEEKPAPKPEKKEVTEKDAKEEAPSKGVVAAVALMASILVDNDVISEAEGLKIADALGVKLTNLSGSVYSKSELNNMFDGM